MTKFTITATDPRTGRSRSRRTEHLYTHATCRGGEVVGFHIDEGTARRAAARRSGTTVVETVLDAKAQALLAEQAQAEADKALATRGHFLGKRVFVRTPLVFEGGKKVADNRNLVGKIVSAAKENDWGTKVTIVTDDGERVTVGLPAVLDLDSAFAIRMLKRNIPDR